MPADVTTATVVHNGAGRLAALALRLERSAAVRALARPRTPRSARPAASRRHTVATGVAEKLVGAGSDTDDDNGRDYAGLDDADPANAAPSQRRLTGSSPLHTLSPSTTTAEQHARPSPPQRLPVDDANALAEAQLLLSTSNSSSSSGSAAGPSASGADGAALVPVARLFVRASMAGVAAKGSDGSGGDGCGVVDLAQAHRCVPVLAFLEAERRRCCGRVGGAEHGDGGADAAAAAGEAFERAWFALKRVLLSVELARRPRDFPRLQASFNALFPSAASAATDGQEEKVEVVPARVRARYRAAFAPVVSAG
ncbi:hypothetical protein HK405_014800, partial [Cladochytrium tenue]